MGEKDKRLACVVILVVWGLICAFLLPSVAASKDVVMLRLDWYIYGMHAPFFAAQKQGYYEQVNLDVKILEGKGSSSTALLIGNGNDTFGFVDSGVCAKAISEGVPIKMITGLLQRSSMAITSFEKTGIKTPKDLEGKTIGVGAAEALTQVMPAFMAANKVDPNKVKLLTMPPAARPVALLEGKVDAIGGSIYGDTLNFRLSNPDKKFSFLQFADWGIDMLGHGILASNKTLADSPALVRRFLVATLKGWKYAADNPEAATDILLAQYPDLKDKRTYFIEQLKMVSEFLYTNNSKGKPIGWQSGKDWETMRDLLVEYGGVAKKLPVESYFTNDFLPK